MTSTEIGMTFWLQRGNSANDAMYPCSPPPSARRCVETPPEQRGTALAQRAYFTCIHAFYMPVEASGH